MNIYQPPSYADPNAWEINTGQSSDSWGKSAIGHDCPRLGGLALMNPEALTEDSRLYFDQGSMFHQLIAHYLVWRDMTTSNPVVVDGVKHTDSTKFMHPYHICELWKGYIWWADIWRLFCEYVKHYEATDLIYKTLFIETVFTIDIPAPEGSLLAYKDEQGKLSFKPVTVYKASKRVDWAAMDRVIRKIRFIDHKTCADLGPDTLAYPQMDGGFHLQNALGLKYFGNDYDCSIANFARKFGGRNKHPAFERVKVEHRNIAPWAQSHIYALQERGRLARQTDNIMHWPGVYTANGGHKSPCNGCAFQQLCVRHSA